jgi:hypothetical protein
MKKLLLPIALFLSSASFAQILNPSFETWAPDTSILDLTSLGGPIDTGIFNDPTGWTSSNAITSGPAFGFKTFCTQSSSSNTGNYSVELRTDTMTIPVLGSQLTLPGFVASGDFKLNLTSFTGGSFSPTSIPGAGVPISPARRLEKFAGSYRYSPIVVGADSCAAIAVLKKGATVIASATFYASATQNSFTRFEVPFIYTSCEIPDSVVIILSSSNPFVLEGLLQGSTNSLPIGGRAWFDDISLVDTTVTFSAGPFANFDTTSTFKNNPKSIAVTTNDVDCYGRSLTVSIPTGTTPNGAVSVSGQNVIYTPSTGFLGQDTFTYTITAGTRSSSTRVAVRVYSGVGINTLGEDNVSIYPNPAINSLFVNVDPTEVSKVVITDMIGRALISKEVSTNKNEVKVQELNEGMYIITLLDNTGKVRFSSKFLKN